MRKLILAAAASIAATACGGDMSMAPLAKSSSAAADKVYPGSRLTTYPSSGNFRSINCVPKESATGSAVIGPTGGTLWIGTHRLIVPAGALSENVEVSGSVPEGKPFEVDLQPHGLQFRKAAGLILDASSCTDVPSIVYLIDQETVSEPIEATYSTWWHTIACPIWHFSGYAIALGDGGRAESESGAQ